MKKRLSIIGLFLIVITLLACSKTVEINKDELIQNLDVQYNSMQMSSDVKSTANAGLQTSTSTIKNFVQLVRDPAEVHLITDMSVDGNQAKQTLYINSENMYAKLDDGAWQKMPTIDQTPFHSYHNLSQIHQIFVNNKDKVKATEEGNFYVLELNIDGQAGIDAAKLIQQANDPGTTTEYKNMKKYWMKIWMDKQTKKPMKIENELEMDAASQGQDYTLKVESKIDYDKYDAIDSITIPQEALDATQ